jgi:hypothetical protein
MNQLKPSGYFSKGHVMHQVRAKARTSCRNPVGPCPAPTFLTFPGTFILRLEHLLHLPYNNLNTSTTKPSTLQLEHGFAYYQ